MSLFMRYRSQEDDTFHGKVVSALRNQFGGHEVVKNKDVFEKKLVHKRKFLFYSLRNY